MTPRERLNAVTRFQETDRPWRLETIGFWDETLARWAGEGMPRAAAAHAAAAFAYFRYDPMFPLPVGGADEPGFFPRFRRRTIEKTDKYKIVRDTAGCMVRVFRSGGSTIPEYLDFPVKSMDDFDHLRRRLRPGTPGRLDNPLFNAMIGLSAALRAPLGIVFSGVFGTHRHLLGFERLMTAYRDDPELLHEIAEQWVELCTGCMTRLAKRARLDFVQFWEDMCYRAGPMISPGTFREFMSPYYAEVIARGRELGVTGFWVDTDGDCTLLIPLFIEAGVNVMYPFEVQSGMDVVKVREEYGDRLAIMGGLDKRVLEKGREEIDGEVMAKALPLLKSGGYIPSVDHCVQPDVPLKNFNYFIRLLRYRIPGMSGIQRT
ncbi:MAG: uroporphyrinogen decarboxylase family protein [bacterium]